MIKINEKPVEVNTPNGIGIVEDIIVTSLGHIQLRIKYGEDDSTVYMKYTVTSFNELIKNSEISLIQGELIEHE